MRRIDGAAPEVPVLREPQAFGCASQGGLRRGEPQAYPAAHAPDGDGGMMAPKPKTSEPHPEHVAYPYLLRGLTDFPRKPGLGDRHHVHPDEGRLRVPGGDHGLVLAASPVLAPVEHARLELLRRGAGGGARALRYPPWRSSTRTRARSSPRRRPSPAPLRDRAIAISMDGKGRCLDKHVFV